MIYLNEKAQTRKQIEELDVIIEKQIKITDGLGVKLNNIFTGFSLFISVMKYKRVEKEYNFQLQILEKLKDYRNSLLQYIQE